MNSITKNSSMLSWEGIKETALQNEHLQSDIRVGENAIEINAPGIIKEVEVSIGLLAAPVYASKEETLANLKNHFDVYFSKELCRLVDETGIHTDAKKYQELVDEARASSDAITQKLTTTIATPSISSSQAIQEAHQGAVSSLYLLRKRFSQPLQTPQFCKTQDGKWSVLQPAPHPENWVLSGGGVKGAGYVGFIKAAEQAGALKTLKRLAGSSAGAITAALMASGMTADDFEKASNRTSFFSILTGRSRDAVVNKATVLEKPQWISGFSGTYAVDHVNQEIVGSIKKYFQSLGQEGLNNTTLTPEEQKALKTLQKALVPPPRLPFIGWLFAKKLPTYMVTFKDLALLQKADPRFKELTVTGYDETSKQEVYYNATISPTKPIAEEVRSSMSLPLIYQPLQDSVTGDIIADGGIGSNIPSEVFVKQAPEKTLVLGFDNKGRFYDIANRGIFHQDVGFVSRLLSGNPNFQKRSDEDAKKLYNAGPNAAVVEHGTLDTTSFMAGDVTLHAAARQAEIRSLEAFSLRQNQAIASEPASFEDTVHSLLPRYSIDLIFDSIEEAMKTMTHQELENIAVAYASKGQDKDPLSAEERSKISQAAQKLLGELK